MTTAEALKKLESFTSTIPIDALNALRETWPEAEPVLLAELDDRIKRPYENDRSARFLYALFFLAEMKSAAAFERYLTLARFPELIVDQIFGDILTESLHHLLANTCNGRFNDLKALAEDSTCSEFSRPTAIYALLELVHTAQFPRATMEHYCVELLSGKLEQNPSYIWDTVITACDALSLKSALPLIKQAYDQHLADPFLQSFESVERALLQSDEEADLRLEHCGKLQATEEEIKIYTDYWIKYAPDQAVDHSDLLKAPAEERKRQTRRKPPGIEPGRNEPCPCGNGKKYKKCCIETGYALDEAFQANPIAGPKNQTDEWIMAGDFYKTIKPRNALICWSQAWPEILKALPESMTDPDVAACNELFNGFDFLSNWIQDFETLLDDLAAESIAAIQFGMEFFPAVLERFPQMNPVIRRNFECSWALLECGCGKPDVAMARLQQMIETDPLNAQGYAVLAALLSFDAKRFNIPADIPAAQHLLLQAKMRADNCADWDVDIRLEDLNSLRV